MFLVKVFYLYETIYYVIKNYYYDCSQSSPYGDWSTGNLPRRCNVFTTHGTTITFNIEKYLKQAR